MIVSIIYVNDHRNKQNAENEANFLKQSLGLNRHWNNYSKGGREKEGREYLKLLECDG